MSKKVLAMVLVAISLTGCSKSTAQILQIPLVDPLSKKEVNDYYKESLKIKDIKVVNRVENEKIEIRDISNDEKNLALKEVSRVEGILAKDVYIDDAYLNRQMYEYMKIHMDDRSYTRAEVVNAGAIRDKYVIDVVYSGTAKSPGSIKEDARYLGVHGAFRLDKDLLPYKDQKYINKLNREIKNKQETIDKQKEVGVIGQSTETKNNFDGNLDVKAYNNILGASLSETALMPTIDMVFTPSGTGGKLSGYGIIAQGNTALSSFGINRNKTKMDMEVRYVLSRDISDGAVHLQDLYVKNKEIDGIADIESDSIFPEFIETEIGIVVDRADRIRANNDITGLANSKVYSDLRNAIYWGHLGNNVNYDPVSEVTRYIDRNNNFYLVEVVTNYTEDIKNDKGGQGIFQETYLVVVEQKLLDSELVIADWMCTDRKTLVEPQIDFGDNIAKRFEYLSLAGQVPENVKEPIRETLQSLYSKGQEKNWNDYYSMLNTDTELLSKTRRDNIYLTVKGWLNRRGQEKDVEYVGAVTDWLSGTSNQVELITQELIIYDNTNKAQLMTNYYLLSNFNDVWVIDELKNIELEDIEGNSEIQTIADNIGSYKGNSKEEAEPKTEVTGE